MNIGFDAKRAFSNKSGLGNYSRNLIRGLILNYPDHNFFLFNPGEKKIALHDFVERKTNIKEIVPTGFFEREFTGWWRSYGITKKLTEYKVDLYHGLSNELPLNIAKSPVKKVVTIHDLIFMRYPEFYQPSDRKMYEHKTRQACKDADVVVAVSNQTKNDLINLLEVPEKKIQVLYQSCGENYFNLEESDPSHDAIYYLPENFILYVGTIEERKNLLSLVKAFHELDRAGNLNLVVVGSESSYAVEVKKYIREHRMDKKVIFLKNINNSILPYIYKKAAVLVYPSIFEGFGIPIIEALASKTPVITTRGGCFREAGGPESLYIDPYDAYDIANAIKVVLNSPEQCAKMKAAGWEHVQQFRLEHTSKRVFELYQSLA